jgi:starch synthase
MHIVNIATEIAPYAKVGGLGDVIQGLSAALVKKNHKVTVILPFYEKILKKHKLPLKKESSFILSEGDLNHKNDVYILEKWGVKIVFIDPIHPKKYFKKNLIYDKDNDIKRFLYLSKAALKYLLTKNEKIDIVNIHDWHTSIVPLLYKNIYKKRGLEIKKIVLTIHNLSYQGKCLKKDLKNIFLQEIKNIKTSHVNLLKLGIIHSDAIVAVSPTYAKDITTKKYGCNLEKTLQKERKKLFGILNGIDTNIWTPQKDPFIPCHFEKKLLLNKIALAKEENKNELRELLNIPLDNKPLVSCITRLVPQKSPSLIKAALLRTIKNKGQFILLGSSNIKKIMDDFKNLKNKLKKNKNAVLTFEYNDKLSHLIYAASDFIIVPSVFEPCGLTQMIAMRYGSIPIVRKTGGLADTVFDIDDESKPISHRNGFLFEDPTLIELYSTLDRAFDYWHKNNKKPLVKKIMQIDFSWTRSAQKYINLYKSLI